MRSQSSSFTSMLRPGPFIESGNNLAFFQEVGMRLAPNEIPPSSTMLVYSELFGAGLASSGITQQPNLNNAKQYMGGDGFESNLQAHYEFSNHQEMQ
jgi:hypothetical protein